MDSHNPTTIAPPFGQYSHAVAVGPRDGSGARWLHLSGQVGVLADGTLAEGLSAQTEQAFANIEAILKDAGFEKRHLVKVTTFLVQRGAVAPADVAAYRDVRNAFLGDLKPASTLLGVAGLASPDWLIEIEAVAAKED